MINNKVFLFNKKNKVMQNNNKKKVLINNFQIQLNLIKL